MKHLFKFCSGDGAVSILKTNSIFVTSPLDLNDAFEMRPAWTDEHEQRACRGEQMRNDWMSGQPIHVAVEGNKTKQAGIMPNFSAQPPVPVESHRGTSDLHNSKVFGVLHSNYRVLSFVSDLFNLADEGGESGEDATLMWTHYGDQFQGVCLVLNTEDFNNGIRNDGFEVQYPSSRQSLPPEFYDCWQSLQVELSGSEYQLDQASGLHLNASDSEAMDQKRFLKLLTHKSPVWSYEREVRMIYQLQELVASPDYKKIEFACQSCQEKGLPPAKCAHAMYRDAVNLPARAIRAVIFGTDCEIQTGRRLFEVLRDPKYAHVQLYWSCLHSSRYSVQYVKGEREYIEGLQKTHTEHVAYAKHHVYPNGTSLGIRPGRKGVNFLPARQTDPQSGKK